MYKIIKSAKDVVEFIESQVPSIINEKGNATIVLLDYKINICGYDHNGTFIYSSVIVHNNEGELLSGGKDAWEVSSWLYNHRKPLNDLIRSLNDDEKKRQEELTQEQQEAVNAVEESEQDEFVFDDDEVIPAMDSESSSIVHQATADDVVVRYCGPQKQNSFVPPLFLEIKQIYDDTPECDINSPLYVEYYYMSFMVYPDKRGIYTIYSYDPINDEMDYLKPFRFSERDFSGLVDCVCYTQKMYYKYYYGKKASKKFWSDFRQSKILSGSPNPNKSHMPRKGVK